MLMISYLFYWPESQIRLIALTMSVINQCLWDVCDLLVANEWLFSIYALLQVTSASYLVYRHYFVIIRHHKCLFKYYFVMNRNQ